MSEVTTIEYNRYMVEQDNHLKAQERIDMYNEERARRNENTSMYVSLGASHVSEYKEQMSIAKGEVERYHEANAEKGRDVKDEVEHLKKQMTTQRDAWIEHGSTLAREWGSEQKKRIKDSQQATLQEKREKAQALKSDMKSLETMRTERRNQAVENRKELRAKIQEHTSDSACQEAKDMFFQQRKNHGDDKRKLAKELKGEKMRQQSLHAEKAQASREQALAAQKAAKASLEAVKSARAVAAKEMRDRKKSLDEAGGGIKAENMHNKKVIHDMARKQKFVTSALANQVKPTGQETPA